MQNLTAASPLRERAQSAFERSLAAFSGSPFIQGVVSGDVTPDQYAGVLAQIHFQTRDNPQLQALSTTRLQGSARGLAGKYLGHAKSEVGHDAMALADIRSLGYQVDGLPSGRPLPETAGLVGFAFHQTLWSRPIAYLGYLFFLEYTPTTAGNAYRDGLLKAGIQEGALTFIDEHIGVDVAHNRMMEMYLEELLQTEEDLEAFTYALETTGKLYGAMLEAGARAGIKQYLDR